MPTFSFQRLSALIALALIAVAGLLGLLPAAASARDTSFDAGFSANTHLGEGGGVSTELTFTGSEYHGQVEPLTGLTLRMPEGIDLSSAGFPTCSKETIEEFGLSRCPPGSLAGSAASLRAVVYFAGEPVEVKGAVQAVFGPGGVLYFAVQGTLPVSLEYIIEGHVVSDIPPYGKALVLEVPLIETEPQAPDGSITALTLNLGTTWEVGGAEVSNVTLPTQCPGSFTWDADVTFKEEASEALDTFGTACPPTGTRATTATMLAVSTAAPYEAETVTYTATVQPTGGGGPAPGGTVTFYDGALPLRGCEAQPLSAGIGSSVAICQVNYSDPFTHTIRATYSGSETFRGSLSHSQTITVAGGAAPPTKEAGEERPNGGSGGGTTGGGSSTDSTSSTSSPSSTGPGLGDGTTATISKAQIAALLGQQLVPSGRAATIGALLKAGGLTMPFTALEAGRLVVDWYAVPTGAKLAKYSKAKPVLVASGQMTFSGAKTGKVKVKLTEAGRPLLRHTNRIKLQATGTFMPTGGTEVGATRGLSITR